MDRKYSREDLNYNLSQIEFGEDWTIGQTYDKFIKTLKEQGDLLKREVYVKVCKDYQVNDKILEIKRKLKTNRELRKREGHFSRKNDLIKENISLKNKLNTEISRYILHDFDVNSSDIASEGIHLRKVRDCIK